MKRFFSIVIPAIIVAVLIWHFSAPVEKYVQQIPSSVKDFASSTLPTALQNVSQQVFAPPPLKSSSQNVNPQLDKAGVIADTNLNRQQNGNLPALTENATLNTEAASKLADMFKQQYFEHENPQGLGPSDLAKAAGYSYISIGENLALGNFKNDSDLLTAWMNSPGHRGNILNKQFTQIGVAVGQGTYQGHKTWMAVQEFGRPASSCPIVDTNLKAQINAIQSDADQDSSQLAALKSQMAAMNPQDQSQYDQYNALVNQYNSLVNVYNNKVDLLKLDTGQYNAEVSAYNTCAAS